MRVVLWLVTMLVAIGLSLGMWLTGAVPFSAQTVALHLVSIYIGAAIVLAVRDWHED